MQKGAVEVQGNPQGNSTVVDTTAFAQAATEPVVPVRSAKDAINAMYASDPENRLSNYLATSAKEIINATSKPSSTKSAANLHRSSSNHRLDAVRPSASGVIKSAKVQEVIVTSDTSAAMDPLARKTAAATPRRVVRTVSGPTPVVKTSLKLGPKKSLSQASPQSLQRNRAATDTTMRSSKGSTALAEMLAARQRTSRTKVSPAAAESIQVMQQAARQTTGATPSKTRTSRGKMMDVMRPARHNAASAAAQTIPTAEPTIRRPLDSVKRRFRTAPKDYIVQPETQDDSYTGYTAADSEPPVRPPVEIYGMMDEEPKPAKKRNPDGLGVVEDYRPNGTIAEQKVATGTGKAAPDNNKYALGGQSPFFLKSVNVEKRPLSDAPISKSSKREAGTLYEQPAKDPLGRKNVYNTPAESKKPLPTKPTVIIPASRRSKAPLVILLLLTVALGAAVGGFVYLLFFKDIS